MYNFLSDQSVFIKKSFNLIKNNFKIFKGVKIKLNIQDSLRIQEFAYLDTRNNGPTFKLSICNDLSVFNESTNYELLLHFNKDYLESLGIEINEQSLLLSLLLHEFGHLINNINLINQTSFENFIHINQINKNLFHIMYKTDDERFLYDSPSRAIAYQHFIPSELNAEIFKFRYFPFIWNLIILSNIL